MKVILVNGSPNKNGCTATALGEFEKILKENGIETEQFYLGTDPIAPCRACRACKNLKRCVIDDRVNEFVAKAKECDGVVIGSPVHYAGASGAITTFLDRAFFSSNRAFRLKLGCAIVSARRAGTTATLDQLNKYFSINEMPIVSGRYWNMVHGNTPDEVVKDEEGMQNIQVLAKNMVYLLKCKEIAKKNGLEEPEAVVPTPTNFIR